MNRRVLLVDADPEFQATLTQQLGRYHVVLMTEHDSDRALALGQADPPDLVIIGVEEPEKLGFKAFQKFRKGLPPKSPIMLVTSSVAPESFAKHKGLKNPANAYLDKRGLSPDELIAKIDNLIGLGDLQDDDVSIPVEEDIPMEIADGDVVLDEQLDDDDRVSSFEHEMATVGPGAGIKIEQLMDAETDAAFDALLGGEEPATPPKRAGLPGVAPAPAAAPEPVPEPIAAAEEPVDSGIPEPVPHTIPDDEPQDAAPTQAQWDMDSVPARVDDGGMPSNVYSPVSEDDDFDGEELVHVGGAPKPPDDAAPEFVEPPPNHIEAEDEAVPELPHDEPAPELPHDEQAAAPPSVDEPQSDIAEEEVAPAQSMDSLASIPIEDDELVSMDDEMIDVEEEAPPAAAAAPTHDSPTVAAPPIDPHGGDATVMRTPIITDAARRPEKKTGAPPAVDLGLDAIAQSADAERDQSGVYDRKALRKIGELERQISQLKTELERARAAADAAAKGGGGNREAQFLNLREANLAKDKELKQVKTTLEQQAKDLAEAQEKLRQAQHAKTALEAKNTEMEERLLDDTGKQKEIAGKLAAATSQVSQLEQELDAKTRAATSAEATVAQLEKDLANERANRAASASEAERSLRVEREQMIARHKGELAALRAELETVQEQALTRLREELDAHHASKLDESIEELRRANAQEHTDAVEEIEKKHNKELVELKAAHAGEISHAKNELGGKLQELEAALAEARAGHSVAIAAVQEEHGKVVEQHVQALAQAKSEHADTVDELREEHARVVAQLKAELGQTADQLRAEHSQVLAQTKSEHAQAVEQLKQQHALARSEHAQAIEQAQTEHAQTVEQLKQHHAAALESLADEHADALERDSQSHGQALSQLKSQLDRTTADHEVKLGAARRELEDLGAQHAADKARLDEERQAAIAELQKKHDDERAQFADAAKRTAESHRNALSDQQQKHEAQLADLQQGAQREVAEARAQVHAAKKAAEEHAARTAAEREELLQAHASTIGELEGKHERALAVASGEAVKVKAIADAERQKEVNALKAEHARALTELAQERDELKKGLSGARDSLKRSEGELASAVQTIADRNADLRAHAAAIAERDQRITDLRKELESLEQDNANYQDQVLRAYQKIKSDEAMVARARKAMAIALTVLDDQGNPTDKPPTS